MHSAFRLAFPTPPLLNRSRTLANTIYALQESDQFYRMSQFSTRSERIKSVCAIQRSQGRPFASVSCLAYAGSIGHKAINSNDFVTETATVSSVLGKSRPNSPRTSIVRVQSNVFSISFSEPDSAAAAVTGIRAAIGAEQLPMLFRKVRRERKPRVIGFFIIIAACHPHPSGNGEKPDSPPTDSPTQPPHSVANPPPSATVLVCRPVSSPTKPRPMPNGFSSPALPCSLFSSSAVQCFLTSPIPVWLRFCFSGSS